MIMSKKEKLGELITDNKENAEDLSAADIKAASDKDKIEKKISKLILANKENALTLSSAYKIINTQKKEIKKQAADLIRADKENAKHKADLISAKKELAHKAKLIILNKELTIQITGRKQAEEALRDSNIFSESLIKSIPFGMDIVDETGTVLFQSDNFVELFGKDAIGKKCWDLYRDDKKQCSDCPLFKSINIGETDIYESHGVLGDRIFSISHTGMMYKGKKAMLEIFQDITERKENEDKLKKSEERFRTVFSEAPLGIALIDSHSGYIYEVNYKFAAIAGRTVEQMASIDWMSMTHPDDIQKDLDNMSLYNSGKINGFHMEKRYMKPDGEIVWINMTIAPYTSDDSNKTRHLCMTEDITERKEFERKLRRSEHELQKAQQITHIGSWYLDVATNEVTWTEELYKMYGFDPTLPVPPYTEHMKLFTPESWEILSSSLAKTTKTGVPYELELQTVRKDGNIGWMWVRGETKTDSEGDTVGLWGAAQDISERKEREKQLEAALKKAEESDRLKSAFLTNMSHEIRTPMNGILGFAELLKEPSLSLEEQKDFIQTIEISGARMLNTINSIVDISKIESGLIGIDIKETNLNEKIEFTYKFFKPEVEIKGLQFIFKNGLPTNEAIVKTDNEKVYGILTNLVRNAIKFTFDGSIEFGYEKKGEYLEFFVKDTGIGIPQKQQQLIFERFRQGSESHNRGYEGSGLGLSISKSYVEMLGGRIWVESEEGRGSTFYFTIPYIGCIRRKNRNRKGCFGRA